MRPAVETLGTGSDFKFASDVVGDSLNVVAASELEHAEDLSKNPGKRCPATLGSELPERLGPPLFFASRRPC